MRAPKSIPAQRQAAPPGSALTHDAAAAYLGLSTRTLWRLNHAGRIPYCRVSAQRIVYLVADLDAYLQSTRVDPTDRGWTR
jgi:excisionase family DNA binding protein